MDIDAIKRRVLDEEHLRLLAIGHYISGAISVGLSLLFGVQLSVMHALMGGVLGPATSRAGELPIPPDQVMSIVTSVFAFLVTLGIIFGALQLLSGWFMKKRRYRLFSFIVALPNLVFFPYGTLLGILTLMVLSRDTVRDLYRGPVERRAPDSQHA